MRKSIALMVVAAPVLWMPCWPATADDARAVREPKGQRSLERMDFGKTPDGTPVDLYVLTNGRITAKVMTYGAILTELDVPDRSGKASDVVLGFDTLEGYLAGHPYFGSTVGRVANRVGGAKFS